jgi:hypothetical protein
LREATVRIRDTTDHEQELEAVTALSAEIRGEFLDLAIFAELVITDIIARHFCPDEDRYMLFFSVVMTNPDLKFSTKEDMLREILKLRYRDILDAHGDLIDQVGKVRRWRNRLAHSHLDTSERFLSKGHKDRIQLIYYEAGRVKQQVISVDDSKAKLAEVSACIRQLVAVQKEVYARLGVDGP